jgi:hypothetical protein
MANTERGEVDFEASGKTWTIRYTANALCEMEDALGQKTGAIIGQMQGADGVSLKTLRAIFWAGLRGGGQKVSIEAAGDVMDAVGIPAVTELIGRGFERAFPGAESGEAEDRPPTGS